METNAAAKARKPVNRYVILFAGAIIQLCAGIIYAWSVFRGPVSTFFAGGDADVAKGIAGDLTLTSSIMLACFVIGIVGGGRAMDKLNPRSVVFVGVGMFSAGMLATALIPAYAAPQWVFLTYGIISGLGVGVCYTSTITLSGRWFPDKRGFATGVSVCAFGFATVVFAPLVTAMLDDPNLGVQATFGILGAIFLVIGAACALLLRNPPEAQGINTPAFKTKQYKPSEVIKTKQYYFTALAMLMATPAFFILNPLFVELGGDRLTVPELAGLVTVTVMITGIASACGRLFAGWFSDKVGRRAAVQIVIAIMVLAIVGLIFADNIFYIICIALIAFAYGGTSGAFPALTADTFGAKNAGINYGLVMIAFGVSALASPFLANALTTVDSNGNNDYTVTFIVAAILAVLSFVMISLVKKPRLEEPEKENTEE